MITMSILEYVLIGLLLIFGGIQLGILIVEIINIQDKKQKKKGKWIEHENPKNVFSIECSECGCWFLHEHLVRNSFCPNCGAKMLD